MGQRYDDLNREELIRLLQARNQRDATRFGLVWEGGGQWMTVRYDDKRQNAILDGEFRLSDAAGY